MTPHIEPQMRTHVRRRSETRKQKTAQDILTLSNKTLANTHKRHTCHWNRKYMDKQKKGIKADGEIKGTPEGSHKEVKREANRKTKGEPKVSRTKGQDEAKGEPKETKRKPP